MNSKEYEKRYYQLISDQEIRHAVNKPFSDVACGEMLVIFGTILSLIPSPPARILDLGCGTGWTSRFFAECGYDVVGIDLSSDAIAHADNIKNKWDIQRLNFMEGDFESITFTNEFDCVIFYDSLHHSGNFRIAIKKAFLALKSAGILVTSEPGFGHSKTKTSVEAMKKYKVTEKDMPPRKIIQAGSKAGFTKFRIYPHFSLLKTLNYEKMNRPSLLKIIWYFMATMSLPVLKYYKSGIVKMIKETGENESIQTIK